MKWLRSWRYPCILVVAGYTVGTLLLSALLIALGGPDGALALLLIPILAAAFFQPRRVYLAMILVLLSCSVWVTWRISSNWNASLLTISAMTLVCLATAEIIRHLASRWKRTETLLRANEKRLLRFIENLPAGAVYIEGQRLFANHHAEAITGYERHELETLDTWFEKLYPGRQEQMRALYETERRDRFARVTVVAITRKDGRIATVQFAGQLFDEGEVWLMTDVTEQLRQALLMQETQSTAHIGGWELDIGSTSLHWTDETYRLHDLAPESPAPSLDSALAFYTPESRAALSTAWERAVQQGEPFDLHLERATADGSTAWMRSIGKPEMLAGRCVRLYGSIQDITDRVRAEEVLRQSEERLAEAQRVAHIGSYEWTMSEDAVWWSEEMHRIFGLASETAIAGRDDTLRFVVPEDRVRVRQHLLEALAGTHPYALQFRIQRPDGQIRTVMAQASIQWDQDGHPVRLIGTVQDVTERVQAEEALRQSEERFRFMAEQSSDMQARYTPTGTILWASPVCRRILGYEPEELVGRRAFAFIHPDDTATIRTAYQQLLGPSGIGIATFRQRHKNGSWIWVEVTGQAIRDATTNQVVEVQCATRDISDRVRAEEERRRLQEQIRYAQKLESLGVLAGGIAHDFNNLLVAILGNAELALLDLLPTSPARECVEEIRTASLRAAELSGQMLAYSGRGLVVAKPIDLNRAIAEIDELVKASIARNATLRYELATELPMILGDTGQLRQVLLNLVVNASEALDGQPGSITIRTSKVTADRAYLASSYFDEHLPEGEYVCWEVIDTGCGMGRETLERIFDPFFSTKFVGRGLGLPVVFGIVRGHRGTIQVESEPGFGSTFRVLLPVGEVFVSPRRAVAPQESADWVGHGTLLLIDDEETVRRAAQLMLERLGFRVLPATSGAEGIEILRSHAAEVSLVLLDLTMPDMHGEQVFQELHQLWPHLPVVLASGYAASELRRRYAGLGLAGFVQKPFQMELLRQTLRDILVPLERRQTDVR